MPRITATKYVRTILQLPNGLLVLPSHMSFYINLCHINLWAWDRAWPCPYRWWRGSSRFLGLPCPPSRCAGRGDGPHWPTGGCPPVQSVLAGWGWAYGRWRTTRPTTNTEWKLARPVCITHYRTPKMKLYSQPSCWESTQYYVGRWKSLNRGVYLARFFWRL